MQVLGFFSSFRIQSQHKTTFDAGYLVPVYLNEVLPGDSFSVNMTAFARLATPLFPIMDNMYMDTFFFFVPNRLVWDNWQKFQGERIDPDDSIDYVIPQCECPAGGYAVNSLQDYMGLPTVGQMEDEGTISHNTLFLRAYNLIWNEWFRDENLQDSVAVPRGDGPDNYAGYNLLRRGKRHDYFTSCLPWPQKGDAVVLPLGDAAVVTTPDNTRWPTFRLTGEAAGSGGHLGYVPGPDGGAVNWPVGGETGTVGQQLIWDETGLSVDLSTATAATVNALRQSFQVQKLLERDARGGTRYTEIIRSHFGVVSPDARLQRPEYLGGGSTPININPVAQTSSTDTTSPLGTLGGIGTAVSNRHGFTQAFTEHGMIIGLAMVRADLSYQQGLRRMWSRKTRYDFYMPVFAHLGEQAVLNKEIYCIGTVPTNPDDPSDERVFGYQERWAEYRYMPSMITGRFRSTSAGTLDAWHLSQHFTSRPTLSSSFIQEVPPLDRVIAVGEEAQGSQFIFDSIFDARVTRPMPMYSVPGLIDHF